MRRTELRHGVLRLGRRPRRVDHALLCAATEQHEQAIGAAGVGDDQLAEGLAAEVVLHALPVDKRRKWND